jgi:hypothetical protein
MQTHNRSTFTTIHTEGSLLPVDLLERIRANDPRLEGLTPESYHLAPGEKLGEAINRSWNRLNGLWGAFQAARGRLGPDDAGTTLTRERWLLPLFQELGYGRLVTVRAVEIDGKSYPISHRWQNVPLHLVGCGLPLERKTAGAAGASRLSPHSLVQEYLNRSDEAQWGIVSNGLSLRALRDNAALTRQAYVDFDLESMFAGEVYADFVLLWLVCHQSRVEVSGEWGSGNREEKARTNPRSPITDCLLETWSKSAQERGTRALDDLRRGVEEAIVCLGQGFLQQPLNTQLRARLKGGDLSAQDYYRQLLRLVYRLIFLFTAEDRGLLLLPDAPAAAKQRYLDFYSTARLRELAERQRGSRHYDRFEMLKVVMGLLRGEGENRELRSESREEPLSTLHSLLALPSLGGLLFDSRSSADLNEAKLDNQALLSAVRSLAFITERGARRAVDYRNLGPEELGSVYESLLELHPLLHIDAGSFELTSAAGNERKTTGSYYTPSSLIKVLLDSALDPVIEDAMKENREERAESSPDHSLRSTLYSPSTEARLLDLKVCDPACGSGHFLIAAAHRVAGRLAQVRAGGDEPSPEQTRRALRDVIRHCIYGVDINPMAVELCKVNLWLESLEPGKPLSFLDAHIQCGDSLVGMGPGLDITEIPDEAFNPVFGDDKPTAAALKRRNKRERGGQLGFRWQVTELKSAEDLARWRAERAGALDAMPEDDPAQVEAKARAYADFQTTQDYIRERLEYDLWTAAFFWPIPKGDGEHMLAPTQQELLMLHSGASPDAALVEQVRQMAEDQQFFHWELAFPGVFTGIQSGFDCVLGNPPWERIKLQEEEFFALRDTEIASAPNKAARQKLIDDLSKSNPALAKGFIEAKHAAECVSKFVRISQRYPLTAVGDVNTYALFAEHFRDLMNERGRAGMIVPTGIATDDTTKSFFGDLVEKRSIASLFDFENREKVFPAVDSRMKFCLLTLSGMAVQAAQFAFFATGVSQIQDRQRRFSLNPAEIALFNPNTRTMPAFRTRVDQELAKAIYSFCPIFISEADPEGNSWKAVLYKKIFDMALHSHLFHKRHEVSEPTNFLPLYEAKMIHQYDHRFSSYSENSEDINLNSILEKNDPSFSALPRYVVNCKDVLNKKVTKRSWALVFRSISRNTDERTMIATIVPLSAISDSLGTIVIDEIPSALVSCLLANLNALVLDFFTRQKVTGVNLSQFYLRQLPLLSPMTYSPSNVKFITNRVFELLYTSDDIKSIAEDFDYQGTSFRWDEDHRALLRAELDAYYARLYGLNRKQLRYILDPADLTPSELEDILDPWEEIADPLDAQGYARRTAASDFPGETFRVLKEKELKQHGEYRTRRLVLEAWERLGGQEIGATPPDWQSASIPVVQQQVKPITVDVPVGKMMLAEARPPEAIEPAKEEAQPALTDFGLYKCTVCGKMLMGFEKEAHQKEKHGGKNVEWKKVR